MKFNATFSWTGDPPSQSRLAFQVKVVYLIEIGTTTESLGKIKKLPTDWNAVQEMRQDTKDRWTALFGEQ